ncbi:hypothetical protein, partial [Agrobacterium larrymoorei]|uniref:hypothetical protein n=1 Tax=Agrobacterium larrymoorei TaxID=160699 RepID=UPI001AED7183
HLVEREMPKRQNRRHPHPDATPLAQDRQQNQPNELIMKINQKFYFLHQWNYNAIMCAQTQIRKGDI